MSGVIDNFPHVLGEHRRVAIVHQIAVLAVIDKRQQAADARRDNRYAASRCFESNEAEALVNKLSDKAMEDAVKASKAEVQRSETKSRDPVALP